jgi:type II secretory pathway pseudopilin PulG
MFIVNSYLLAVVFCFITMLCWGSWANSQKLAAKSWRYELFYWDYVIGMILFALLIAFTMGSCGTEGRPFLEDVAQANGKALGSIILGGVIFNASNILLSASTSIAGLAVAFPLGVGISLVLGTIINYIGAPAGNPVLLFIGVALIVVAIIAVLVAIAIPIFTAQLEKSREATDLANIRSAYAEQMAALLEWDGTTAKLPAAINVPAKQTQENWQSNDDEATTFIAEGKSGGGIEVTASTKGYVVSVKDDGSGVEVNPKN